MKRLFLLALLALTLAAVIHPVKGKTATYPPGIMFAGLLNNLHFQSENGFFNLGNQMQAVFLPEGTKGHVLLKKADGSEICKYPFSLELIKAPYMRFDFLQPINLKTGQSSPNMVMKEPGYYVLEFYADNALFYKFPFGISKVSSEDPFAGGDVYVLEGAWSDWAYLFYSEANPEQSLVWKVWLRHKGRGEKDLKIKIEVTRDKDKKLICTSRGDMTHSVRAEWVRFEFDLINPMELTSGGAYFKAKDLLAVDGGYTLTMKIDGKIYGVWKFNIAGGKLQPVGQAERGKANPLTFIEGGKDAFWFKKQCPCQSDAQ